MKKTKTNKKELFSCYVWDYIKDNIIDCDISYRGGSLKIDISGLLDKKSIDAITEAGEDLVAGAYQNYLGGGIAGAIIGGQMFDIKLLSKADQKKWPTINETIKRFFYEQNNGGGDDYMQENMSYIKNQSLPASYPGL